MAKRTGWKVAITGLGMTGTTAGTARADANQSEPLDNGYGRARLRLGIVGVGLWVVFSAVMLSVDAAARIQQQLPDSPLGDITLIALLLTTYVLVQLPFDWQGGYQTPKRFKRRTLSTASYVLILIRGIAVHVALMFIAAMMLLLGGRLGGISGAYLSGVVWLLILITARGVFAQFMARLNPVTSPHGTKILDSDDEGFTGGITGLIKPKTNILPDAWRERLRPELFDLANTRRQHIIRSGAWRAGQIGAFAFTAVGLWLALLLSGPGQMGTGAGVVETMLWFTLWSFAGLLVLPTLSRKAAYRIDQQLIADDISPDRLDRLNAELNQMQDAELDRPGWIETIFYPVPSVIRRQRRDRTERLAFWDIARTAVYLGIGAGSLLTRSVHCNVGRPALWVWLPTDG